MRSVAISLSALALLAVVHPAAGVQPAAVVQPAAGVQPAAALPPVECVELLRGARIAHGQDETSEELTLLRRAFEEYPDEIVPVYALLEYDRAHGLPESERRLLQERLQRRLDDPDRPLPPALLQWIARDPAMDEGLVRQIASSVSARLTATEEGADVLLTVLADLQVRLGQEEKALETLERLWRRGGNDQVAWSLLRLAFSLDDMPLALEVMESHEDLTRSLWSSYVNALLRAGRLEEARTEIEERIAQREAAALGEEEAPDEVFGELAKAPEAVWLEWLAWRYRDAGRDAEAEKLFRRAASYAPDDAELQATLLHLYASDDERAAQADSVDAAWDRETDAQALLDEGTQRLATGDAEGALGLLERAAPHFPDLEAVWFNLGMAAYRLERWEQTADALERAAALNPDRVANVFFAGVALVHLERCTEAVDRLERVLELDPGRTLAHYYLASCNRTLGRPEEAERHRALYDSGSG